MGIKPICSPCFSKLNQLNWVLGIIYSRFTSLAQIVILGGLTGEAMRTGLLSFLWVIITVFKPCNAPVCRVWWPRVSGTPVPGACGMQLLRPDPGRLA